MKWKQYRFVVTGIAPLHPFISQSLDLSLSLSLSSIENPLSLGLFRILNPTIQMHHKPTSENQWATLTA